MKQHPCPLHSEVIGPQTVPGPNCPGPNCPGRPNLPRPQSITTGYWQIGPRTPGHKVKWKMRIYRWQDLVWYTNTTHGPVRFYTGRPGQDMVRPSDLLVPTMMLITLTVSQLLCQWKLLCWAAATQARHPLVIIIESWMTGLRPAGHHHSNGGQRLIHSKSESPGSPEISNSSTDADALSFHMYWQHHRRRQYGKYSQLRVEGAFPRFTIFQVSIAVCRTRIKLVESAKIGGNANVMYYYFPLTPTYTDS